MDTRAHSSQSLNWRLCQNLDFSSHWPVNIGITALPLRYWHPNLSFRPPCHPVRESVSFCLLAVSQSVSLSWFSLFSLSSSLWSEQRLAFKCTPRVFTRLNLVGALLLDCSHAAQRRCDTQTHSHDTLKQKQRRWNGYSTLGMCRTTES